MRGQVGRKCVCERERQASLLLLLLLFFCCCFLLFFLLLLWLLWLLLLIGEGSYQCTPGFSPIANVQHGALKRVVRRANAVQK